MKASCYQFILIISILFCGIIAQKISDCDSDTPNSIPFYTKEPQLVSTTTNGKLYVTGLDDPKVFVLHVYGEPFEMGVAHGTLLKEQINKIVPDVELYAEQLIEQYIQFLPSWMQKLVAEAGVIAALDATYWITESYIPQHFIEEIRGLAQGSGMDYMRLMRIHMIPELIKAQCTIIGAWGPAVDSNFTSVQLRALDWTTNGPFQKYPAVIVYHPNTLGHDFAIVTWTGFVGAITGFSSAPIGLSQKVWLSHNGTDSRIGIPFHFLLRDILQFDSNVDSAISRIANAARTCSIWIGLGDNTNTVKLIEYSYDEVEIYDDKNFPSYPGHPLMDGIVFVNKRIQPSSNRCLGDLLQKFYRKISPTIIKEYITAFHQTGDMQIAIYDYKNQFMYVSNASPYVDGKFTPAWARTFFALDMIKMWNESL